MSNYNIYDVAMAHHINEIAKREGFVETVVNSECNFFQKIYVKLALKFKWRIWFIGIVHEQVLETPYDVVSKRFGVKVNGETHWFSKQVTTKNKSEVPIEYWVRERGRERLSRKIHDRNK